MGHGLALRRLLRVPHGGGRSRDPPGAQAHRDLQAQPGRLLRRWWPRRWGSWGANQTTARQGRRAWKAGRSGWRAPPPGLKPKDLAFIPQRVAIALQADGWYARSEIIWSKKNPQPESVRDRPTRAHEPIYLLTKSPQYHYNADAVREPYAEVRQPSRHGSGSLRGQAQIRPRGNMDRPSSTSRYYGKGGRNRRTIWSCAVSRYKGAHFATFPPALVRPCIQAGCPEGGVVLDPFAGSGTVGVVAHELGRRAVLADLSPAYLRDCAVPRLHRARARGAQLELIA